jgi:hypothetical protein
MIEAGYWKSAKLIPKKCGKAQIASPNKHRCGKLIHIECVKTNLSTFYVDKFVTKCAEMRKYM